MLHDKCHTPIMSDTIVCITFSIRHIAQIGTDEIVITNVDTILIRKHEVMRHLGTASHTHKDRVKH
jgi:hypothetical protein